MEGGDMTEDITMRKVNLSGVAPTPDDIKTISESIGHKLPQEYIDFISDPNAEYPAATFAAGVEAGRPHRSRVTAIFSSPEHLIREYIAANLEQEQELEDFPVLTFHGSPHISGLLPIAATRNSGTSRLCLAVDEAHDDYGAVYFRHVSYDFGVNEYLRLASSFTVFLKELHASAALVKLDE